MECIPNDPYLEFGPNTLQDVRREFDLHQPGAMREVVASFEEWVNKQNHFTKKDFTKHFLETSIILSKGSLERAKKNLDKLCTLRTLIPKFFSKHNPREQFADLKNAMIPIVMPKLTKDNYRVLIIKAVSTDFDSATFLDYYRLILLICEYLKAHDYSQGLNCIVDVSGVNVATLTTKHNVIDMQNICTAILEGYGWRVKGIHVISESKAVDLLVSLFKQVVSEKVGKRAQAHKTIDSVYEHFEKDLLPKDYGGKEKSILEIHDDILNLFSTKENVEYFKEIGQAGTNEAFRQTAVYNNDILGMPGSFRSLTVD